MYTFPRSCSSFFIKCPRKRFDKFIRMHLWQLQGLSITPPKHSTYVGTQSASESSYVQVALEIKSSSQANKSNAVVALYQWGLLKQITMKSKETAVLRNSVCPASTYEISKMTGTKQNVVQPAAAGLECGWLNCLRSLFVSTSTVCCCQWSSPSTPQLK